MRLIKNINRGWYFSKGEEGRNIPSGAEGVNLPHSWRFDVGGEKQSDFREVACAYYRTFSIEDAPDGECVFLEVKSENSSIRVYLNDVALEGRKGEFSRFIVDLTGKISDKNTIKIVVYKPKSLHAPRPFANFSQIFGVIESARLIGVPKTHFSLFEGAFGIRVTPFVNGIDAYVEVEAFVNYPSPDIMLKYIIYDSEGRAVAQKTTSANSATVRLSIVGGENCPNDDFYLCEVELLGEDMLMDRVGVKFCLKDELVYNCENLTRVPL